MKILTIIVKEPINGEHKIKFNLSEYRICNFDLPTKLYLANKDIEIGIPWSNIVVFQIESLEKNQFSSKENT